jgi:hypothetical protein
MCGLSCRVTRQTCSQVSCPGATHLTTSQRSPAAMGNKGTLCRACKDGSRGRRKAGTTGIHRGTGLCTVELFLGRLAPLAQRRTSKNDTEPLCRPVDRPVNMLLCSSMPWCHCPCVVFGKVGRGRSSLAGHAHNSRVNPSLRLAALRRHLQRSRLSRRTMPLQRTLRARGSTAAVWAGGVGAVPCQGCRPTGGAGA